MGLADVIFPVPCLGCRAPGASICPACIARLEPPDPFPVPLGLDSCAALVSFEGVGRQVVTSVKYRNDRSGLRRLVPALAELAGEHRVDHVTWAPTTASHRRARGFDQAELLARALGRQLGVPSRPLLVRRDGPGQTGRSATERHRPVPFGARGSVAGSVLVVDDVITTGSTLAAAAAALRRAGADQVHGLALAHTPPRSDPRGA
jgi:predicted amidophosphoribosyltransferase